MPRVMSHNDDGSRRRLSGASPVDSTETMVFLFPISAPLGSALVSRSALGRVPGVLAQAIHPLPNLWAGARRLGGVPSDDVK